MNDGSHTAEPAMRVSQVLIEPVLKQAIDDADRVEVRFGWAFERFKEVDDGVVITLRSADGVEEQVRADYLVGCDGGASRVRRQLDIGLTGQTRIAERCIIHFESDDRQLLQAWGPAWHHQSNQGTLVAQDDKRIWTLLGKLPEGGPTDQIDSNRMLAAFAGRPISHRLLVGNRWAPHFLVADRYAADRVFLAGDAVHQYMPTGGYGMNTGVGDAFDLGWKLAATCLGFGGPALLSSYETERRPVGVRNCEAAKRHVTVRTAIADAYVSEGGIGCLETDPQSRRQVALKIAGLGNAENESAGIEHGYSYASSPVVCTEPGAVTIDDPLRYQPCTTPGVRLPNVFLEDGSALYDALGDWFTLLLIGEAEESGFVSAAQTVGTPLKVLRLRSEFKRIYETKMVLVRPDHHVAWRGNACDSSAARKVLHHAIGWSEQKSGRRR